MEALASYESLFDRITSRRRISELISRLVSNRLFINVLLPDSDEHYASTVLEVNDHHLVLDELNPEEGHELIQTGGTLTIQARLEGAMLVFSSPVIGIGEHDGVALYRLEIPKELRYMQRRKSYRVLIERVMDLPVMLELAEEKLGGILHDISAHGLSLWLPKGFVPEFERATHIPRCRVQLPNEDGLDCAIEVRSLRHERGEDRYLLGARFVAPEPRMRQRLAKMVTGIERYVLRKRAQEKAQ